MPDTTIATVETVTAEVRVLMLGNRQITLSVFKQLDRISPFDIEPFGRVRSGTRYQANSHAPHYKEPPWLELVGRDRRGNLVKSIVMSSQLVPGVQIPARNDDPADWTVYRRQQAEWNALRPKLLALPLIVLAGLR